MRETAMVLAAFFLISAFAAEVSAKPDIVGKEVDYSAGGAVMKGYLAYDKDIKGRRPGVLVVHEWWGISDYERKRARMLAGLGYTALAVDMYGEGKQATNPDTATKFSSEITKNLDISKARFLAGLELLRKQPSVDPDRIAAIGYCFGGAVVLNMALQGVDLRGVASFHGSLGAVKPAKPGGVKAKILVFQGKDDKFVPPEQVEVFRKELERAGADFRIVLYPGATHAFTNPKADEYAKKFNLPIAYNAAADRKSWAELKLFLKQIFRK